MRLKYMLDTNICIYIAKKKPASVMKRFEKLAVGEVGMSIITYSEFFYAAQKSQFFKKAHETLIELTSLIPALELNHDAAEHYGEIRAHLEKNGTPIGNNDLWIASHARASKVILATNNVKEFSRVPNLHVENWV